MYLHVGMRALPRLGRAAVFGVSLMHDSGGVARGGIRTWAVHGGGGPIVGHASREERYQKNACFPRVHAS